MGFSALLMVRGRGISKGFIFSKNFYLLFGQPRRLSPQGPEGFVSPDDDPPDLLRPDRGHGVSQLVLQEDVVEVVVLLHDLTPFPFLMVRGSERPKGFIFHKKFLKYFRAPLPSLQSGMKCCMI